jgi:hypothetical protein
MTELPGVSNGVQRCENKRKNSILNYKSAALPAELYRHLPGKILSDAASASLFLYAFSIRPHLTPLKASFWTRAEHTGVIHIVFELPQRHIGSQLGAATGFV